MELVFVDLINSLMSSSSFLVDSLALDPACMKKQFSFFLPPFLLSFLSSFLLSFLLLSSFLTFPFLSLPPSLSLSLSFFFFLSLFLSLCPFFYCLITLTQCQMEVVRIDILGLFLSLSWLWMMLAVDFQEVRFIKLKMVSSIHSWQKVFYHE